VFGAKGYVNERKKRTARAAGVYWAVKEKLKAGRRLLSAQKSATAGMAPSGRR